MDSANNKTFVVRDGGVPQAEVFERPEGFYLLDLVSEQTPVLGPYRSLERAVEVADCLDIDRWLDRVLTAQPLPQRNLR
jgi:hypothetical protein